MSSYAVVALAINFAWSLVWSLTGSSASSLQEAVSGTGERSTAALLAKLFTVVALMGCFSVFARFAKARIQPPSGVDGGRSALAMTVEPVLTAAAMESQSGAALGSKSRNKSRRRLARSRSPNWRGPSPKLRQAKPTTSASAR